MNEIKFVNKIHLYYHKITVVSLVLAELWIIGLLGCTEIFMQKMRILLLHPAHKYSIIYL